ncbi:protein arginine methyltransferase NDUFAF7, mitochondrial [Brevipalpus obovatus]|uniref:protein arginine methyltransferase NDUFAF7, mitochondrial n=1 Tax=Brevipalpus obovatus TaxID=246614 RepID=UPI003D9E840B
MLITRVCFNAIQKHLQQKIKFSGPITVSEYMKTVLTGPTGFYMENDVFGKQGHFITSPEISQIFGELIAIWLINESRRFNKEFLNIVELGPGRGTLTSDMLRIFARLGYTKDKVQINLVEVSPHLAKLQENKLCGSNSIEWDLNYFTKSSTTSLGYPITWYQSFEQVPSNKGFTFFLANEFFDALPIHKFQKSSDGEWREVLIDIDNEGKFRYIISRHPTPACKSLISEKHKCMTHLEVCPQAFVILDKISQQINQSAGCCLICDYGFDQESDDPGLHDTFRAFRNNAPWDPLKEPGQADLTADVDFGGLKKHLEQKSLVFGPTSQENFLINMGIGVRLQMLMNQEQEKEKRDEILSGVKMLLNDMGQRFKFMAFYPLDSKHLFTYDPPGFLFICEPYEDQSTKPSA